MTAADRPYTDADLRAEAARQHKTLTEDPDFMGIGEAMCDRLVPSTVVEPDQDDTGSTWEELLPYDSGDGEHEAFNTAQRKIHDLVRGAADVSEWAVNLGADGLQPEAQALTPAPGVRIHFAFAADMPADVRRNWIDGIHNAIREGI